MENRTVKVDQHTSSYYNPYDGIMYPWNPYQDWNQAYLVYPHVCVECDKKDKFNERLLKIIENLTEFETE